MPLGIRPSPEPTEPAEPDRVGQLQWEVRRGRAAERELRRLGVRA